MKKAINLTKGKVCFVDDVDWDNLSQFKWCYASCGYAVRRANNKNVYMHREILNPVAGIDIDHIDGDRMNNTRSNLRFCSRGENIRNSKKRTDRVYTSKYKGVIFDASRNKWRAEITVDYQSKYLGRFFHEEDAKNAYNNAAIKYFGHFANINK